MNALNTVSALVLLLLAIVMYQNYAHHTLGAWFAAKFFNRRAL